MPKASLVLVALSSVVLLAAEAHAQAPGTGFGIPEGTGTSGVEHFSPAPSAPATLGSPGGASVMSTHGVHTGRHPHGPGTRGRIRR